MSITTVGLDADDTLWHNETIFRLTHARFVDLLADHGDEATIEARLAETEQRNLRLYGYGVKGFTLSMIETAMELTGGSAPPQVVREILAAGREMLAHPVETLPGVDEVIAELSENANWPRPAWVNGSARSRSCPRRTAPPTTASSRVTEQARPRPSWPATP